MRGRAHGSAACSERISAVARATARKQVIRAVQDAIGCQAGDDGEAESLQGELQERLDAPELDEGLAAQTVPQVVADIVRDLGLDILPGPCR